MFFSAVCTPTLLMGCDPCLWIVLSGAFGGGCCCFSCLSATSRRRRRHRVATSGLDRAVTEPPRPEEGPETPLVSPKRIALVVDPNPERIQLAVAR